MDNIPPTTIPVLEDLHRSYPSGSLEILRLETNEAIQEAIDIAFPAEVNR